MTKSQIVSHFAKKFELSKKSSAMIIEEVAGLAIAETKKKGPLPFRDRKTGLGARGKLVWDVIPRLGKR